MYKSIGVRSSIWHANCMDGRE